MRYVKCKLGAAGKIYKDETKTGKVRINRVYDLIVVEGTEDYEVGDAIKFFDNFLPVVENSDKWFAERARNMGQSNDEAFDPKWFPVVFTVKLEANTYNGKTTWRPSSIYKVKPPRPELTEDEHEDLSATLMSLFGEIDAVEVGDHNRVPETVEPPETEF